MKVILYVLKDLKNPNYGLPLMYPAQPSLMRDLASKMVADPGAMMASYPQDYEVYAVGEWDMLKGELNVYADKEFVCSVADIHALAVDLQQNQLRVRQDQKGGVR